MIDKTFIDSLIGLSKENAIELCKEQNYKIRVTREDKVCYVITMDLRFDRINLECDKNIVTKSNCG